MKRAILGVIALALTGAAIWGLVAYGPYLRWYVRVRWAAIERSKQEPAAQAAWRKQFGDPAATPRVRENNATAVRLTELATAAGVTFQKTDLPASQSSMATYVGAETKKTEGPVAPPPADVRAFLDAHRAGLDAVVDLLTHAERPAWKTPDWPPTPASEPPLMGLKELSYVLVVQALADSSAGHDAKADRALSAAWLLGASLGDFPLLIDQLIAMAMTPNPAMLARRLPVDAAAWRARLGEYDPRSQMMHALVSDIGHKMQGDAQMTRAARADYFDAMRAYLTQLPNLLVMGSSLGVPTQADMLRDGWSVGTIVASIARPGFDRAWLSAEEVTLQIELTDRVLQARQLKAQVGHWPASIPGVETSRVPGAHWVYSTSPDGRLSISVTPAVEVFGGRLRFAAGK